jgi:hypothetical protein
MTRQFPYKVKSKAKKLALALLVLALFTLGMAFPADAQELLSEPAPHQGYFIGAGGTGVVGGIYTKDTKWVAPLVGPSGAVHMGQVLNDAIDLGLNLGAGTLYSDGRKSTVGNISIELKWRVFRELFIRPAIGFGFVDVTRTKSDLEKILPNVGASFHLAVGYDFFPFHKEGRSGGVGVTPVAWMNAINANGLTFLAGGVGIEFTFFAGLPKNQLVLPDESAYK